MVLNYPKDWICDNPILKLDNNNNSEAISYHTELQVESQIDEGLSKIFLTSNGTKISEISEFGYGHTGNILLENNCEP